ncbi:MAG: SpoIID/LytB domain-containing protein [Clostridiales bacterium]|nr:SpoIID/LytB domain-containing protein [Clostridiales bacterium]
MRILAVLLVILTIASRPAFALPVMPENNLYGSMLRVGLSSKYANQKTVLIKNNNLNAGFERGGQFYTECSLYSQNGFTAAADASFYSRVGTFYTYNEALARAASFRASGYGAAPCLVDAGQWTVYVGGYDTEQQAQSAAVNTGGQLARPSGRLVKLSEGNGVIVMFDSASYYPQFIAMEGFVDLGDREYRGRMELMRSGQNLTAVNVCGIEEYLYSVVPSEMPSHWHTEALKAQAAACRSYIIHRRGVHESAGYDLCDGTHCQLYLGAGSEKESATAAVNATRDVMLWYGGDVISAVYFSSSGGSTDSSENVWNSAEPFLRGVKEQRESDVKVWTRAFSVADLNKALSAANAGIGSATGMYAARTENGRVQELVINGTAGQKVLKKEEIRTFFQSLPGGSLESRNFTINAPNGAIQSNQANVSVSATVSVQSGQAPAPSQQSITGLYLLGGGETVTAAPEALNIMSAAQAVAVQTTQPAEKPSGSWANLTGDFVLYGLGSGHGVGMSQHGAQGLAELGWTYDNILKFYYTGVEVRK